MQHLAGPAADGVDEDVDPPEALERLGDHPLAVGLDGHVGGDRDAVRPGGLDPLDRRLARLARPARDRDPGAGPRERLGQGRADAAAAAGHEGDPAVEAEDVELAQSISS